MPHRLGLPVVYHAHAEHHVGEHGSIHHPELRRFAATVTRVHADGRCHLIVFPPGADARHVADVKEGTGPGTWSHVAAHHLDETPEPNKAA